MKKFFLLLGILFIYNPSFSQKGKINFIIKGIFDGDNTQTVKFSYYDADSGYVTKKCVIKNHEFFFSGNINEPEIVQVTGNILTNAIDDANYCEFFVDTGLILLYIKENHFKEIRVIGSETQNLFATLNGSKSYIYNFIKPGDSMLTVYNKVLRELPHNDTVAHNAIIQKRMAIINENYKYNQAITTIDRKFIATHPNSYISAYLLYYQFYTQKINEDSVKIYFSNLSRNIQQSNWGLKLSSRLGLLTVGTFFPKITGVDNFNKQVAITSENNIGYNLIIIWASWCVPCLKDFPILKSIYEKYRNKGLKIIAITADDSKQNWLNAIHHGNIENWEHIFTNENNAIVNKLGLSGIPAEILTKDGRIINKYSGADNDNKLVLKDLQKKLKQLFD